MLELSAVFGSMPNLTFSAATRFVSALDLRPEHTDQRIPPIMRQPTEIGTLGHPQLNRMPRGYGKRSSHRPNAFVPTREIIRYQERDR
jgi:hypothetical protein